MSSNISDTFPMKYDNPSINVRKTSGDLDERKKTPDTQIIRKQPIQEPVNPKKRAKITLTDVEKNSPSVNYFFERKQMIDDFEAKLTGSLTQIG